MPTRPPFWRLGKHRPRRERSLELRETVGKALDRCHASAPGLRGSTRRALIDGLATRRGFMRRRGAARPGARWLSKFRKPRPTRLTFAIKRFSVAVVGNGLHRAGAVEQEVGVDGGGGGRHCFPFLVVDRAVSPRSRTSRMVSLMERPSSLPTTARRPMRSSGRRMLMSWEVPRGLLDMAETVKRCDGGG